VTLTVHDHAAGDGPTNLASNGIPFEPGALTNEANFKLMDGASEVPVAVLVLARWHGDNSIRSALLQFNASFGGASKTYSLEIGATRNTSDISFTPVTWDYPKKIITMPAHYLCSSKLVWEQEPLGTSDYPDWEDKQLDFYSSIEFEGATLTDCANSDQYYNSIHASYQLYARTGNIDHLLNGRKWALHHARDQVHLSGDRIGHGICSSWTRTRYTYIQGLVDDYFLWGLDETRDVAGIIADYFYMVHHDNYYYLAPGQRWDTWTEREPAFALLGLVAYYEATNDVTYLNKAKDRVDALYQMQLDNGGTAWVHSLYDHDSSECGDNNSFGVSPWMSGLLLEGIIKYHKLTGYSLARQSILWAIDYLMDNCVATGGAYAGASFTYLCGCDSPVYTYGEPDLDNMISHAFAYGYVLTGNTDYKNLAVALLNTSVDNGWTRDAKHYNEQFRSSGHAVSYLSTVVPTLVRTYSAAYTETGIEINWDLSEAGIGMEFFVTRAEEPSNVFIEIDGAAITGEGLSFSFVDDDIEPGRTYSYRIEVVDEDGHNVLFETEPISTPSLVAELHRIFPNPFNPQTAISYTVATAGRVTLNIYNARGRLIRTLVDKPQAAAQYIESWNGRDDTGSAVASGVYFVRLESGGRVNTKKAVLLR